jgi:hypothetical protein
MPKKDGTGPTGKGPLTGRGSGKCIIPLNTKEEELDYLKNREKVLRDELRHVETRVKVLEAVACRSKR